MPRYVIALLIASITIRTQATEFIGTGALDLPSVHDLIQIQEFITIEPLTPVEIEIRRSEIETEYRKACDRLTTAYEAEVDRINTLWEGCEFNDQYLEKLKENYDLRVEQLRRWKDEELKKLDLKQM